MQQVHMKQINKSYCCVGLMSGTSLDGLDLVLCQLTRKDGLWTYQLHNTNTVAYSEAWQKRLTSAASLSGYELMALHRHYGDYLGQQVNSFLKGSAFKPDVLASHGHTVFHQPAKKVSLQIGDGAMIAAQTGIPTVSDFRTLDITLGGQGAPLVPIGDQLLFPRYQACVNLGGFANLSCDQATKRVAWDISPVNFVVNRLVQPLGKAFDENGSIGQSGRVIGALLERLNKLPYYQQPAPKSLGEEWVNTQFCPILDDYRGWGPEDLIRTCYEHFAMQITSNLNEIGAGEFLFTGGGVYNRFLMQQIADRLKGKVIMPDTQLIDFKEALVFALLGVLRMEHEINCLASVTGARCDSSSGVIHWV
ncbi:MAG: anhydro-N-acetylmuramic acid kinase [Marinilabiliaceae bacterium]|nr:anhydro-N-acetylmuramic acid kinase [Marinilabiliaceae bacterium]